MPNANALITVAAAKSMIKLTGSADDSIIEAYINGTSDFFENYCCTKFINQAITEVLDGGEDSGNKIIVEYAPIVSLQEIKFGFDEDTPEVKTLTDFNFNAKAGIINYKAGIVPAGWQNIQVKYTSGYGAAIANMPADLQLAAMLQVEFYYKRDSADFSTTFEEGFILRAEPNEFAPRVKNLIAPFKRVVL